MPSNTPPSKSYRLSELAALSGAALLGDPDCIIQGLAPLDKAQAGQLSFLDNPTHRDYLKNTQASAVIISPENAEDCSVNKLINKQPRLCFAKIAKLFLYRPSLSPGIHSSVIIGKNCIISPTARIGPYCVLGDNVIIGDNTVVSSGCSIGDYANLGPDCYLWPKVTLYHQVIIGKQVIIHSGAVIGSDGFGMVNENGTWHKIPQLGSVVINNNVEIGSNTTIDRGTLENTIIQQGVKLDNQIQIAHNVIIGEHTAIAACVGIAGSSRIGKYCMIGGATGIADHVEITDNVMLTGMTMVTKSITKPGIYSSGTGFQENTIWHKNVARFKQLDTIVRQLKAQKK